jgi:hypothetical protein
LFTEVMFVIKGGENNLTLLEYLSLENSSNLRTLSEVERKNIFDSFLRYERMKAKRSQLDYSDVVRDIMKRVGDKRVPMEIVFLDECQDLLPCHWRLLQIFQHRRTKFICSGDQ